jgi:glycosyltransferase involved in cell wall biosynthesis
MRPFFSVITVTKNTEKKINLTIKSVLSQNFKNFEYIVIDGYSKDNTFVNIKTKLKYYKHLI